MDYHLKHSTLNRSSTVLIGGSKSESNRLLVLQALFPEITVANLSDSEDTRVLQAALQQGKQTVDIGHAGTSMRFLTAYFAVQQGRMVTLTGSDRMKKRPIKVLVEALRAMGATIDYLEEEGFPPLQISGTSNIKAHTTIDATVSSQYITALLLVAPSLPGGLRVDIQGEVTSKPYLEMTLQLLRDVGVHVVASENTITIRPFSGTFKKKNFYVSPDWSSASYFYQALAFSKPGTSICLPGFQKESLQGDAALARIFQYFGVYTTFGNNSIIVQKKDSGRTKPIELHLQNTPDLAQTIAVTCYGLQKKALLTGLHTLPIKETNRLEALQIELSKLGAVISTDTNSLQIHETSVAPITTAQPVIETYDDHRMAMAFAPLALLFPVTIKNAEVVKKSYPGFWQAFQKIGLQITAQ